MIRKTVLIIIDGFGYNPDSLGNAILSAKTPNLDYLWSNFPHTLLKAAEEEVGLFFGQIGNSEVGHMAIGSGRVVQSPLSRITTSLEDGTFFTNHVFKEAINHCKKFTSNLHIIGMISSAGVHADIDHMIAIMKIAKDMDFARVYLHPILDGRDTGPREAQIYLEKLEKEIKENSIGTITTLSGRAYAMDRNKNWERTQKYYDTLIGHYQKTAQNYLSVLRESYSQGIDDENIFPTILHPEIKIVDNDAIMITNFREDRVRQITHALFDQSFSNFARYVLPKNLFIATMTQYEKDLKTNIAFPTLRLQNTLSDVLEKNGIRQLHIAETEKYAHVTYFLNGGREDKLEREDFEEIVSDAPEKFLDYPQMQAHKITERVMTALKENKYQFIIINFANPDMIGHTGNFKKTISAVEVVDTCVGKILPEILSQKGVLFITSDHGNAEQKIDLKTNTASKDHTINPVPFIVTAKELESKKTPLRVTFGSKVTGLLQDVAPSILSKLNLPVPDEMTGVNLFP